MAHADLRHHNETMSTNLGSVETPAAILDLDAAEANIKMAVTRVRAACPPGTRVPMLRPHVKSHKTPTLALLQIELSDGLTVGVCCQKTDEAVAMCKSGVVDILLSNEVVDPRKLARLAALVVQGAAIRLLVDDAGAASAASDAAAAAGVVIGVLIEVDVGHHRCGVAGPAEAVSLANVIATLPGLRFDGIQAYHGMAQHVRTIAARREIVESVALVARSTVVALQNAGFHCNVVTGGGSGTFELDAATGVFTELQPGSYVLNDVDYSRNMVADGSEERGSLWAPSLFLASTVMSTRCVNRDFPDWIVLDSGLKAQSVDSGSPIVIATARAYADLAAAAAAAATNANHYAPLHWDYTAGRCDAEGAEWFVAGVSDEHTTLTCEGEGSITGNRTPPQRGDVFLLMPGHCDPFVNHFDELLLCRSGRIVGAWPVAARGPGL